MGIAYYDQNGKYCYTGNRPQTRDIDIYPYPIRERYALDKNVNFAQILTGRGCIGKCAFCFEGSKTNNILRLRSVNSVCEELDYLVKNLPPKSYITFLDDTFILNPKRTKEICNWMIEKYNGDIRWFCEARVDILIRNLELLPLMKKAGLLRLQLGGESGSQKILDVYKKGIKIEDLKLVVRKIYEAGIDSVYINYIVGGAFETYETFNETLELAKELLRIAPGCAEVGCSLFAPYVGSPIYLNPERYGINIIDTDLITGPDGFTTYSETNELSMAKLMQLKNVFDNETNKQFRELIPTLSFDCIKKHYQLDVDYNINTFWFERIKTIEHFHNYFQAISKNNYEAFRDLDYSQILNAVPFRTEQPISDGEKFYRRLYGHRLIENTELENSVIFLSAGKVAYWEIIEILKRKYPDNENLENEVLDIYKQLDKEYMIVWKTMN